MLHNIQEATIVNDISQSPRIYAALENRQVDYWLLVIEVKGMVFSKPVYILIDSSSTLSYVSPKIVEQCKLKRKKHFKSWLLKLAIGTKRKVTKIIENYPMQISELNTTVNMNILALGSYDLLIGKDLLEEHRVVVDYFKKSFVCIDGDGNTGITQGI